MQKLQTPNRILTRATRIVGGVGIGLLLINKLFDVPIDYTDVLVLLIIATILIIINNKHRFKK